MELSSKIKKLIRKEYKAFEDFMYNGKSKEERDALAQFFTPPEISIKLIEELSDLSGNVLDPTSGSGNLLAAALIAGADASKIFGNDYDATMVELCKNRIKEIPDRLEKVDKVFADKIREELKQFDADKQIHRGNALHEFALTYFDKDYDEMYRANNYQVINGKRVYNIDNENYDAYIDSPTFAKKYPDVAEQKQQEALRKQAEDAGYVALF